MKTSTSRFYQWKQTRTAAEKLQIWAFSNLLKSSTSDLVYPLTGAARILLQDGTWGIIEAKPRRKPPLKQFSTAREHVAEYSRVKKQLKRSNQRAERLISRVNRGTWNTIIAWLTHDLGNSISHATELLSKLAQSEREPIAKRAVIQLATVATKAAIELEQLSFKNEYLPLLQHAAHQMPFWAAVYSPHPKEQKETLERIKKLGVGVQNNKIPKVARWDNTDNVAGQYAFALADTLARVHMDQNLGGVLSRNAVFNPASKTEVAAATAVRSKTNFISRTPDADTEELWRNRLKRQGWPGWVIELHSLPPLSPETAVDWFNVGWEALQEAAGGDITTIPELRSLGQSSSGYCDKRQIKMRLKKAFLSRFGSGTVIFGTVEP